MDELKLSAPDETDAPVCGGMAMDIDLSSPGACDAIRRRGRPRAFDPKLVLEKVLEVFWERGFAATSLDDLAEATGVSRPSLAAAFGDKEALYIKSMQLYRKGINDQLDQVLTCNGPGDSLLGIVRRYFEVMIATYTGESDSCLGCAFMSTAVNEAPRHESIMDMVQTAIAGFDQRFEEFFSQAQAMGCMQSNADPKVLSQMIVGLTANIGMRARAGATRKELQAIINDTTAFLFD